MQLVFDMLNRISILLPAEKLTLEMERTIRFRSCFRFPCIWPAFP